MLWNAEMMSLANDLLTPTLLVAQTGFAKTMLGYVAVGVLIVMGLAMVCRPSHRISADKKK